MKKLMIVEDDSVAGFVYRDGLRKEGFEVDVATDGEAGLHQIETTCPDAVLLDVMMPKLSGIQLLKRMRAQEYLAKIPVMVFTNAFVPALIKQAMDAGATQVFNKAETTPRMVAVALKNAGCSAGESGSA